MRALVIPAVLAVLLMGVGFSIESLQYLLVLGVLAFVATVVAATRLARRRCLPSDPE